jgi:hypothetical protein
MIIQEAIKSGKPFKRKEMLTYMRIFNDRFVYNEGILKDVPHFIQVIDILATDWEIKDN